MIASFFDGRVRLRGKALKDPEFLANIKEMVGSQKGILEMKANPKVGSLLILYDPAIVTRKDLFTAAELLQREASFRYEGKQASGACLLSRKQENSILAALYGLTILSGFASKRLHIASGVFFSFLALKHLYDRKHCM